MGKNESGVTMSLVTRSVRRLTTILPRAFDRFHHKELAMNIVISRVRRFLTSEDGPTAVEYAVMLSLIVVAIVGIVGSLGTSISGTFSR